MSDQQPHLEGIVLSAGRSSRAGLFKPLFHIGDEPLVRRVTQGLIYCCQKVYVVCGHRGNEVAATVADLDQAVVVEGVDPDLPMFESVRQGIARTSRHGDGLVLTPVDCLGATPTVLDALIQAWSKTPERAAVPVHGDRRGHPVILPASLRAPILAAPEGRSLRDLLDEVGRRHVPVPDPAVLTDLDLPHDFHDLDDAAP